MKSMCVKIDFTAFFIPASNEPSIHACMDIWRLPRGSKPPLLCSEVNGINQFFGIIFMACQITLTGSLFNHIVV